VTGGSWGKTVYRISKKLRRKRHGRVICGIRSRPTDGHIKKFEKNQKIFENTEQT